MGYIFCLMGKSASGKDTIYKKLLQRKDLHLKRVIPYTTRPIRSGEKNGVDYFFCTEDMARQMEQEGRIIELRAYHTIHGVWKYFTADDGQVDFQDTASYLMIGTLESYNQIRAFYGSDRLVPLLIEVEDGLRLSRALERERTQTTPKYAELCRRFLADEKDFSPENIRQAEITRTFVNENLNETVEIIADYMKGYF